MDCRLCFFKEKGGQNEDDEIGDFNLMGILSCISLIKQAHEVVGTKPVVAMTGMYEYESHEGLHLGTPILIPSRPLEGLKPVIKMLGEVPRTTLTTEHLRREPWKYQGELFYGSKPVLKMLRE